MAWLLFKAVGIIVFLLVVSGGSESSSNDPAPGCKIPSTPYNGNFEVEGCEGVLKDPFFGPCWKNPKALFPANIKVFYFCNPGFSLRGMDTLTCQPSGNWSHPFPRCCIKRLNSSDTSSNKVEQLPHQVARGLPPPSLALFEKAKELAFSDAEEDLGEQMSCPGLEKTANVEFECLTPDGRLNDCLQPPYPPFSVAHLKCAKYYRSAGDLAYRYRKCKIDGSWSREGSITCVSDCGKSDFPKKALITNGVTSEKGQYPWHAGLYLRSSKGQFSYICGGSLISKQVIVTAAHCVTRRLQSVPIDPQKLMVIVGKYSREFSVHEPESEQRRHSSRIIVHPQYSPLTFESDIALIVLDGPIDFTFYARPVCFPENFNSLIEEYQLEEGNVGTVVGWGLTSNGTLADVLQEAHLPVVGTRTCIDSYGEFFRTYTRYTNFCAGYTNGTAVCNGDSGSGMVFPSGEGNDQRFYLQGIVSSGASDPEDHFKCDSKQYALFTRVGRFSDWIVRTLTPDGYL